MVIAISSEKYFFFSGTIWFLDSFYNMSQSVKNDLLETLCPIYSAGIFTESAPHWINPEAD